MISYFRPLIIKLSESVQLSVVTADKAYDSEDNHVLVRDVLHALSVIPARYEHVPIRMTCGRYRKQMKRGYCKLLYNQRNKNETIVSVIKRLFGEHITSRLVKTQNRELSFRCIAYNIHRLTNLTIIIDGFYKAIVILFFQGKKDKRNEEAYCIQSRLIRKEVKSIFFAVVGTTFIFALLMMTGAYALTVHPLNPQNPLTMFASTPDGFTNNDPHTIQTIFATVRKADLGQYGFQWQASGQVKNTSDKALKDLNVNIQLIDSTD